MSRTSIHGRVVYMAQGPIGKRPAGNVTVRVFPDLGTGRREKPLWTGVADRQGRVDIDFDDRLDLASLDPAMRRLMERRSAVTGYVVEITDGKKKARLPVDPGREMVEFVLPWAPERGFSVQIKPVKKANPDLPKMSREDLDALLKKTGARVESTVLNRAAAKRQKLAAAQDVARFKRAFPKRTRILKDLERQNKSPEIAVKRKVAAANGGKPVQLMHPQTLIRDMVMIEAEMGSVEFQRRHHKALFELAEDGLKRLKGQRLRQALKAFRDLAHPTKIATAVFDEAVMEVTRVGVFIQTWLDFFTGTGAGAPASCGGEEGTGFGGDATPSGTSAQVNSVGLMANNDWPLKPFTTCVRDQGSRGTCTAFGIVAAAECLIAADFGRWMNLSEQDLYMHQKKIWFPLPLDWYGDGYNAVYSTILQSLGRTYVFPFERDWDYNKSPDRTENDAAREYALSCVGYNGEACSDTNHQAELIGCYTTNVTVIEEVTSEVCNWVENAVENIPLIGGFLSDVVGEYVCEPVTELIEVIDQIEVCVYDTDIPASSGFQILNATPVWVPMPWSNPDWAVVKAMLTAKRPVVFCFEVSDSFDGQSDGYITYSGGGEDSRGGHCALITGFVNNSDLPFGAPNGAGGGYFVVKNSWGAGWGDQGYCYVPFDWAAEYGTAMVAVNAVSP